MEDTTENKEKSSHTEIIFLCLLPLLSSSEDFIMKMMVSPQWSSVLTYWKVVYMSTFLALTAYVRHFMLHGRKACSALKGAL